MNTAVSDLQLWLALHVMSEDFKHIGFIKSGMVTEEFGVNGTHSWLNLNFPKTNIIKDDLRVATKNISFQTIQEHIKQ